MKKEKIGVGKSYWQNNYGHGGAIEFYYFWNIVEIARVDFFPMVWLELGRYRAVSEMYGSLFRSMSCGRGRRGVETAV